MPCPKGMTLMEIIVVLVIVGIAAAFFFPNFNQSTQLTYSQSAEDNLLAIYSAQLNYFNNNSGVYCNAGCGNNLTNLNNNLNLNITDSIFNYQCTGTPFTCTATATNGTTWTINDAPIVLTGANRNPSCAGTYCPN